LRSCAALIIFHSSPFAKGEESKFELALGTHTVVILLRQQAGGDKAKKYLSCFVNFVTNTAHARRGD